MLRCECSLLARTKKAVLAAQRVGSGERSADAERGVDHVPERSHDASQTCFSLAKGRS
jgi:hypothetical protein